MSLARGAALRARIQRSVVGTEFQMELGWRMVGIKTLAHNFPGRLRPRPKAKICSASMATLLREGYPN